MNRSIGSVGIDERDVILDSINEGVFTVDLDWRISTFNRAAEQMTGVKRSKAIGRICRDVFRANICEKGCPLHRTFDTGKSIMNATAFIINHKNQRIPIRISTALLRDCAGVTVGGVESFQDLSLVDQLRKDLQKSYTFADIIGRSPDMKRLFDILPRISESDSTVLIEGSSGTGKELIARAIHNLSSRRNKPFIPVNCGALPDSLCESELFGYRAGAFTDAKRDKPGRFILADSGTIFLDEICDTSPAVQIRLLRVLQDQIVEPIGGINPVKVNVRIVAATNKNLQDLVKAGIFREDLFYRILVIHVELPDLSERREDIPLLIDHFLTRFNRLQMKDIAGVSDEAMACLLSYNYPGNIRELENIMEQAFVMCLGRMIELRHLPPKLRPATIEGSRRFQTMKLRTMEKILITETLQRHKGNRICSAQDLGIDTTTLFRKIRNLKIETPKTDGRNRRR